jgi:CubicO group peptidase (beta-lactamase class C family)
MSGLESGSMSGPGLSAPRTVATRFAIARGTKGFTALVVASLIEARG